MSDKTNIEWTNSSWNPIVGCSIVSPGCTACYAMRMAARIEAMSDGANTKGAGRPVSGFSSYTGTTKRVNGNVVWTGKIAEAPEGTLTVPLRWKRPRRIFVNSMGDLFHESIPDKWIDRVFAVMGLCPQHTFQVLTKRAERMRAWMTQERKRTPPVECLAELYVGNPEIAKQWPFDQARAIGVGKRGWPLPNVWLGVSCERQQEADERIPHLLATPAAVRFVSCEPLLSGIDLRQWIPLGDCEGRSEFDRDDREAVLSWVIVGGESGPNARPMHLEWAYSLVDQCRTASVPCFVKQVGAVPMLSGYPMEYRNRKGGDMNEWPDRLQVRKFPEAVA